MGGRRRLEATCHWTPVPMLPATHWPRTGPPCQQTPEPVCATSAFLPREGRPGAEVGFPGLRLGHPPPQAGPWRGLTRARGPWAVAPCADGDQSAQGFLAPSGLRTPPTRHGAGTAVGPAGAAVLGDVLVPGDAGVVDTVHVAPVPALGQVRWGQVLMGPGVGPVRDPQMRGSGSEPTAHQETPPSQDGMEAGHPQMQQPDCSPKQCSPRQRSGAPQSQQAPGLPWT